MKFQIKGGLGAQISSIIAAHAIAYENNSDITEIVVSNVQYDKKIQTLYPEVQKDIRYFEYVLNFTNPIKISESNVIGKTHAYNTKTAELICKHIDKIRTNISINFNNVIKENCILHLRMIEDKRVCGFHKFVNIYDKIKENDPMVLFDDDKYDPGHILGTKRSPSGEIIDDWRLIANSDNCYGSISAFTVSAALLNPLLRLWLIPADACVFWETVPAEEWNSLDIFSNHLSNIKWLSI